MGKFEKKTNTRHLLFQWAMNNLRNPQKDVEELFFLAVSQIAKPEECDMKMFNSIKEILLKKNKVIQEKINNIPDSRNLRCCTDVICVLALAEFEYLGNSKNFKGLIIQEYLKLTDHYSPQNDKTLHFIIDKLL
jgi:transcription termination factor NusB